MIGARLIPAKVGNHTRRFHAGTSLRASFPLPSAWVLSGYPSRTGW